MSFQVDLANIARYTDLTLENITYSTDTSDSSVYTFSSVNIGIASASRYVIAAFYTRATNGDPSITSVTIGGVTATLAATVSQNESGGVWDRVSIYYANVPSGTTANIVITHAASQIRCGYMAGTSKKGIDLYDTLTDIDTGTSGVTVGGGIDVNPGGIVVAISGTADSGSSASWTGATEVTDADMEFSSYSAAYLHHGASELNRTVQCTWGNPTLNSTFVAASFR